ncbi:unnamed protein product [Alopecurus aequalis]
MPKHYRAPGKKKEGNAAKYITRTKAVSYLQISLAIFRKLCILKGVFPREPKKKVEGNHKTYYHMKDIAFLAHDPLIEKFREIKVQRKKVKKAVAKKNRDLADRLLNRPPTYKLDRLIIERYPSFVDALRDLDDCLTMVHLFAALPAVEGERVQVQRIHNCRRLSHEWQAYISRTNSLRKTFISVKGIYYQAEVQGQTITWLTPHALQQVLTDDVDFNVMLTFLEFYETLLGFVNFKLYHSINVNYPPILDPRLEALAAELYALSRYMSSGRLLGNLESDGLIGDKETENSKESSKTDESELRLAQLQHQLPSNERGALMHLVDQSSADDTEENSAKKCRNLFKSLKFYLSREVPRESLLFIIPAFGGTVSWEGEGSPFDETDEDISHQIVDRPTQSHVFLSRKYVQPQWIFDCANACMILPTEDYIVGRVPPPHLSPFVDYDKEGYVPERAEAIKKMQGAQNQVLPLPGMGEEDQDNSIVEARSEYNEVAEKKRKLEMLEKQYHEELKMEIEGNTFSNLSSNKADNPPRVVDEDHEELKMEIEGSTFSNLSSNKVDNPPRVVDEDDAEEANEHVDDPIKQAEKDNNDISLALMSRKKRGLYNAMKRSEERKRSRVELLKERKRKAESSSASAKRR